VRTCGYTFRPSLVETMAFDVSFGMWQSTQLSAITRPLSG
jgi:hypothetical protein